MVKTAFSIFPGIKPGLYKLHQTSTVVKIFLIRGVQCARAANSRNYFNEFFKVRYSQKSRPSKNLALYSVIVQNVPPLPHKCPPRHLALVQNVPGDILHNSRTSEQNTLWEQVFCPLFGGCPYLGGSIVYNPQVMF